MYEFSFTQPFQEAYFGGKRASKGDVGVEIEVELNQPYMHEIPSAFWRIDADGSLRGHGYEFILAGPMTVERFETEALPEWEKLVKGYKYKKSPRTSVHVHFNMRNFTFPQILNFGLGYWLIEDWLTEYCGPSRKGNLFCLTNSCADDVTASIRKWLKHQISFNQLTQPDAFKYTAFNLCPLRTQGSVEIRTMRGVYDKEVINTWVRELNSLKNKMVGYPNPVELMKDYVKVPKRDWVEGIFSKEFVKEIDGLHKDDTWKDKADKAFFDLIQIANAIPDWNIEGKTQGQWQVLDDVPVFRERRPQIRIDQDAVIRAREAIARQELVAPVLQGGPDVEADVDPDEEEIARLEAIWAQEDDEAEMEALRIEDNDAPV